MLTSLQLVTFLVFAVFLLALCYASGLLFGRAFGRRSKQVSFLFSETTITGLLIWATGVACWHTGFKTVLLPVPLLLLLFVRTQRGAPDVVTIHRPASKAWLVALLSCAVSWFYFAKIYLFSGGTSFRFQDLDTIFYARLVEHIGKTGVESSMIEPVYAARFGVNPYHYGDIWSIAGCKLLFHTASPFACYLIYYPAICALFATAVYEYIIAVLRPDRKLWLMLASTPLLIYTGFKFTYPSFLPGQPFDVAVGYTPKIAIAGVTIAIILYRLRKKDFNAALIFCLVTGIIYTPFFPPLLACLFLVFAGYSRKRFAAALREVGPGIVAALLVFGYLVFFYKCWGYHGEPLPVGPGLLSQLKVRTAVNIFIGNFFQVLILAVYIAALLLAVGMETGFKRDRLRRYLQKMSGADMAMAALLPLMGSLMWAAIYPVSVDSAQFFINVLLLLEAIYCCFVILLLLQQRKLPATVCALVLIALNVLLNGRQKTEEIDAQSFARTKAYLAPFPDEVRCLSLEADRHFRNLYDMNVTVYHPVQYIHLIKPGYYSISLNSASLPVGKLQTYQDMARTFAATAPLSYFIAHHPGLTPETQTVGFMKYSGARFLTVSADTTLPAALRPYVNDSLALPAIGYTFYKLGY